MAGNEDRKRPPESTPGDTPSAEATPESTVETGAAAVATRGGGSAARLVAAGIFSSRIIGFVRERAIGYFFGIGPHADVLRVALRAPNLLQNLLGEGSISAAFIPIYSRMLAQGRPEDAGRFAGAVLGLLTVLVSIIVAIGVLLAEPITAVFQPGWLGDADKVAAGELTINRYQLAVQAVKITFPMAGLLVLSAWALGVLNSHRRFFIPYFAPVLWNVAIIGGLIYGGMQLAGDDWRHASFESLPMSALDQLLFAGLAGALIGGGAQFAVQLPAVWRVIRGFRLSLSTRVEGVRQSFRAFLPVLAGRGVYQLSGYLDLLLAGFAAVGAISALAYAQVLYTLPVSLFAMSVAASELPELSRLGEERRGDFLDRINRSVGQIVYMVAPSIVGYLLFGWLTVAVLYQTGSFGRDDTWLVYLVLAAYALGLLATTISRLLQNAFYALDDTKTPARIAVLRVAVSAIVGASLMLLLDRYALATLVDVPADDRTLRLGAVGLALGASAGAWIELGRLLLALRRRLPTFHLPAGRIALLFGLATIAAIPAGAIYLFVPAGPLPIWLYGMLVLGAYGTTYLGLGVVLGVPESEPWIGRLARRFRRQ